MNSPPNNDCLSERQASLTWLLHRLLVYRQVSKKLLLCDLLKKKKKACLFITDQKKGNLGEMENSVICFIDIPDKPGTTAHLNNHSMDPSNWAETSLSNLSPFKTKLSDKEQGKEGSAVSSYLGTSLKWGCWKKLNGAGCDRGVDFISAVTQKHMVSAHRKNLLLFWLPHECMHEGERLCYQMHL